MKHALYRPSHSRLAPMLTRSKRPMEISMKHAPNRPWHLRLAAMLTRSKRPMEIPMKHAHYCPWRLRLAAMLTLSSCGGGPADPITAAPPPSALPATPPEQALPAPAAYRAAHRRSPFQPAVAAKHATAETAGPDFGRSKALLESFALDELHMVGTLAGRGTTRALVRDPQGRVHALRTGDYLGMDHGRIQAVRATGVDLVEIVRNGSGGWTQRARVLALRTSAANDEEAGHGA